MTEKVYHGWYSSTAAKKFGYNLHVRSVDGNVVAVTGLSVDNDTNINYAWPDRIYVGVVEGSPIEIQKIDGRNIPTYRDGWTQTTQSIFKRTYARPVFDADELLGANSCRDIVDYSVIRAAGESLGTRTVIAGHDVPFETIDRAITRICDSVVAGNRTSQFVIEHATDMLAENGIADTGVADEPIAVKGRDGETTGVPSDG